MSFESVSVESPRLVPRQESSLGDPKRRTDLGNDRREAIEPEAREALLKQIMIEIAMEKIAADSLCDIANSDPFSDKNWVTHFPPSGF
jgi:hypothetical protein